MRLISSSEQTKRLLIWEKQATFTLHSIYFLRTSKLSVAAITAITDYCTDKSMSSIAARAMLKL